MFFNILHQKSSFYSKSERFNSLKQTGDQVSLRYFWLDGNGQLKTINV